MASQLHSGASLQSSIGGDGLTMGLSVDNHILQLSQSASYWISGCKVCLPSLCLSYAAIVLKKGSLHLLWAYAPAGMAI